MSGNCRKHGVIVDACIHAPHTKSGSDERNFHAHIMFTSRQIDPQTGDFAKKKIETSTKSNPVKPSATGENTLQN